MTEKLSAVRAIERVKRRPRETLESYAERRYYAQISMYPNFGPAWKDLPSATRTCWFLSSQTQS